MDRNKIFVGQTLFCFSLTETSNRFGLCDEMNEFKNSYIIVKEICTINSTGITVVSSFGTSFTLHVNDLVDPTDIVMTGPMETFNITGKVSNFDPDLLML